jgi:hypothetical protein
MLNSLLQDAKDWLYALPIIAVLFFIGTTGVWLRRAIESLKYLKKFKQESLQKGLTINNAWIDLNNKFNRRIWIIIFCWLIVFGIIFFFLPQYFIISLVVGVVLIGFGFFGIRVVPEGFDDIDG